MKLVSFVHKDVSRAGVVEASGDIADLGVPMMELLSSGDLVSHVAKLLDRADRIPAAEIILVAPVPRPGKVLAIGLNYRDHAEESGQQVPKYPVVFAKVSTCITGPEAPVERPRASAAVDWEAELCFVIGKRGRHIAAGDALQHVAGYMCGNDVSVRDWQFHNPTWMMGKGFDTHGPTGPWLVTSDELDPGDLDIKCFVNGELMQSSNTSQLIFDIPAIIEYLSTAFTLEPGDVIFTGTPAGVGISRKPPVFLKAGDVVRVEIDGLGTLENPVIEERAG
jgi:2-keto-4-pentenoate hydratase/2-oxohepta-3-ene-1,7-dioic acid hydratase in catechol pathway